MEKAITPTSPPGNQRGFTLLELLVVLILLGAAAAVVMPSFVGGLSSLELETSTRDLITRMKQARTQAVARQSVRRIVLSLPEVPGERGGYALADEFERPIRSWELPRTVEFVQAEEMPRVISFYPNGRSSGGRFQLKNVNGKVLTVQVDPITGFGKLVKEDEESV